MARSSLNRWLPRARSRRGPRPAGRRPLRLEVLEGRVTPSTLIYAGTDRRDLVYDPTRDQLDITTSSGTVQRYDANSGALLSPFTVPGSSSLNGADLTPDGSTLLATDSVTGGPAASSAASTSPPAPSPRSPT